MTPNPNLYAKVMSRLEREKRAAMTRRNIAYSGVFLALSLAGFLAFSKLFVSEAADSGFFDFLRLAFSDVRVISQSFNELVLSLVQALPFGMLAGTLALFTAAVASLRSLLKAISGFQAWDQTRTHF